MINAIMGTKKSQSDGVVAAWCWSDCEEIPHIQRAEKPQQDGRCWSGGCVVLERWPVALERWLCSAGEVAGGTGAVAVWCWRGGWWHWRGGCVVLEQRLCGTGVILRRNLTSKGKGEVPARQ